MGKQLKKTLPYVGKSKAQLEHEAAFSTVEDPLATESRSYRIILGKERFPKHCTMAKFATNPAMIYANFENTVRAVKVVGPKNGRVAIIFWASDRREWLETTVPENYPLTTTLSEIKPENVPPTNQEAKMPKANRKHGAASKPAVSKEARSVNEKTGCKTGSVGDKVGLAILSNKDAEKQLGAVKIVIRDSFKAKGKSTAEDAVERQAKSWIGFLRKQSPKIYGEAPKKAEAKKEATKAAA